MKTLSFRLRKDTWLFIGLFAILIVTSIISAIQKNKEPPPPALASFSNAPDGARALRLWLEKLGYPIVEHDSEAFSIPEDAGLLLILEPTEIIQDNEWETIDQWVNAGGVLLLAGSEWPASLAAAHYDFELDFFFNTVQKMTLQTPVLASPPITGTIQVNARNYFSTERQDYTAYLELHQGPVLLSFLQGQGLVILCATPYPFSNIGLKASGNPELTLNIIQAQAFAAGLQGHSVWFDEWHHGIRSNQRQVVGPEQWLRYTPTGHALLFAAVTILLALVLQGRAFGRPVPILQETIRRAPLEYITALANLSRRAGHRRAVLEHYYHRLKRDLGKRYRIDPTLSDEEYVDLVIQARPEVDRAALLTLLKNLRKPQASEKEIIQLARQASNWTQEKE